MIRKLLLLLVVITILQNTSYSQQATVLANCFYQNAPYPGRIVIRLAIRNNTASGQDFELSGIRVGVQYNAAAVTPAGYVSYMYESGNQLSSLNAAENLVCIGGDTYTGGNGYTGTGLSSYSNPAETSRIAYTQDSSVSKVMQRQYFNRSSDICASSWGVPPGNYRIFLDLYFTLNDINQLSYYNLNNTLTYGFDSPDFIAQGMNSHTANLKTAKSEIGIVLIRNSGCDNNPYQPISWTTQSCVNGKVNPVTINGDSTVNFISPMNGVLAGKAINTDLQEKEKDVLVQWQAENNELVDYFEVQRKDENGEFKTIGIVMSDNKNTTIEYKFSDKITARDIEAYYRVKVVGTDKTITYSDIKKIKLRSEQSVSVKVFPNPSSETIRINLPESINSQYVCRMYSAEGRIVKVTNVSGTNPSVDIKSLNVGSYFMELYNPKSGKRFYTQFSKQ